MSLYIYIYIYKYAYNHVQDGLKPPASHQVREADPFLDLPVGLGHALQ